MAIDKNKVTARLPRRNPYTGILCGYEFVNGVAEDVSPRDVKRFHWEVVETKPKAPEKPKASVEITLDNLEEAEYGDLRSFYFAHKDEEGFPKPASQSEENLREAIGAFLVGDEGDPDDPDEGGDSDPETND